MNTVIKLALTLMISGINVAHANDAKGYAGAACAVSSGTGSISSGRMLNGSSANTLYLYCPLVNDSVGMDFVDNAGVVWFLDTTSAGSVSCTQYSRYQTTSSVSGWSASGSYPANAGSTSTYTSTSPTMMTFNGVLGTSDVRTQATWNYFYCTVPASTSSGIIAYYADEN